MNERVQQSKKKKIIESANENNCIEDENLRKYVISTSESKRMRI